MWWLIPITVQICITMFFFFRHIATKVALENVDVLHQFVRVFKGRLSKKIEEKLDLQEFTAVDYRNIPVRATENLIDMVIEVAVCVSLPNEPGQKPDIRFFGSYVVETTMHPDGDFEVDICIIDLDYNVDDHKFRQKKHLIRHHKPIKNPKDVELAIKMILKDMKETLC